FLYDFFSVKVGFGCKSVSICDGILENEYVLDNIHFHWNSEHTLNGKKYPLESHFVHYIKEAENLQNALNIPFGIAVIAVFYEFSSEGSEIFNKITKKVECVATNIKEPVPLDEQLVPKELLPKRSCNYYAYTGSLTTPDCNEPVQWIIFPKPCKISPCQLEALKNIYDEDNKPILRNARPLQPLNGRIVKYVKESFYGKFKKK
ncbi:carbonic anhydrase 7-like, partial [Diorhabda sublineata]|uniref:carbonic anhydrase 7-like n=1 Tax=Diorhabda sublineata TaxID=1163346 RepID=UPI0024E06692